jgi:hypothetical protein
MRVDSCNNAKYAKSLSLTTQSDNTVIVSDTIDTAGWGSVTFLIALLNAADADTTIALAIFEGDASNMSDEAAVSSTDLIGSTSMGLQFDKDNYWGKFGYKGSKRYVRYKLTPANNTGSLSVAGAVRLGHAYKVAQTTQLVQ